MGNKLGIDLGGTKIEAVVINDAFQVVKRKRVPTNREEGYEAILGRIVKLANELMEVGNVNGFSFRKHNQSPLDLSRLRRLRGPMLLWQSIPDLRENSGAPLLTCSWMKTSRLCSPASTRTTMMRCWTDWTMSL